MHSITAGIKKKLFSLCNIVIIVKYTQMNWNLGSLEVLRWDKLYVVVHILSPDFYFWVFSAKNSKYFIGKCLSNCWYILKV